MQLHYLNIFIHHEWYKKWKKEKQLEHQTNKQWYGLTILTILTTVYNSVTITTNEQRYLPVTVVSDVSDVKDMSYPLSL